MWKGLRRLRDSRAFIAPLPRVLPISFHFKRLSRILAPNVQIGLPVCPPTLPVFNRARVTNCTEISDESSQKAQELNCWISKRRTIEPKWDEWKQILREETFEKLGTTRVVVLFFRRFWKLLVYLILEVARNLNRRFWLNGICQVGVGWRSGSGSHIPKPAKTTNYIVNFFRNVTPHGLQSSLRQPCGE